MAKRDLYGRVLGWAERRQARVGLHNPWVVALRVVRQTVEDRVSGLAAEMAFFALLSLVPLFVTIGAALGYLEQLVGSDEIEQAELFIIRGMGVVFSPRLTGDVIAPFVRALLGQERGGLAFGGLIVTIYLASRVFTATIRSLDLAYGVQERRGLLAQRLLAVGLSLGFVLAVVLTLAMMVVGPLLGSTRALAARFGLGDTFEVLWGIGRWPLLVVIVLGFLSLVYRFAPNVESSWRHCLPGAVLGVALWVLASLGLRVYLATGGSETGAFVGEVEAVRVVARAIGAVVATIVWTYLTGLAILIGGELNAELARPHRRVEARGA